RSLCSTGTFTRTYPCEAPLPGRSFRILHPIGRGAGLYKLFLHKDLWAMPRAATTPGCAQLAPLNAGATPSGVPASTGGHRRSSGKRIMRVLYGNTWISGVSLTRMQVLKGIEEECRAEWWGCCGAACG